MVYIARLELQGFKSFGNFKTSVSFDPHFTCIAGKNGSGKSTLVEALRFVIGEMSAKQMRAERFSDLLFSGGNGFKPARFAEVSLYLDNGDGGIPLASKEVIITRRMDKEGKCTYYINGRRSSRQELMDLIGSSKFSLGEYSFVFQGEVDNLARMTAIQRRELLDEMAGVAEFEEKKTRALQELEEVERNLEVRRVQLNGLEGRIRELQTEMERLAEYRKTEGELEQVRNWLSGVQYMEYKRELEEVRNKLSKADKRKLELEEALERTRKEIQRLRKEREVAEKSISKKQQSRPLLELEGLKGAIRELEEQVLEEDRRRRELEEQLMKAPQPLIEFRSLLEEFRSARRRIEDARSLEEVKKELTRIEQILDRIDRTLQRLEGAEVRGLPSRSEYENTLSKLQRLRERLDHLKNELQEKAGEAEKTKTELQTLHRRVRMLENRLNRLEKRERNLSMQVSELQLEISALRERKGELEGELKHLREVRVPQNLEIHQLERKKEELERKLRGLGPINFRAEEDFKKQEREYQELLKRYQKLVEEKSKIEETIREVEERKRDAFMRVFEQVNSNFSEIFRKLQPEGEGRLVLQTPENPFEGGLEIRAKFGGVERDIFNLSGGERALVTLAFLFALQRVKPSALYVFDEVDASLDPINVQRVAQLLKEYAKNSQLILVTFRDAVMAAANRVLGVTKQNGISQVYSLDMRRFGE
ncbi:MAG: AAA family ATPase [Candidatus Hadarchaeales archaeon]